MLSPKDRTAIIARIADSRTRGGGPGANRQAPGPRGPIPWLFRPGHGIALRCFALEATASPSKLAALLTTPAIMPFRQRGSILGSILGILVCGVGGGFAAWASVTALGVGGVLGAILAAVIGMVVATALWTGGTTLLRALGWVR